MFNDLKPDDLIQKIDPMLQDFSKKRFLHTSPHHDDTMLAYFPIVQHLVLTAPSSKHHFATMTSGFNSVGDEYLLQNIESLEKIIKEDAKFSLDNFSSDKNYETKMFLDGISKNNQKIQAIAKAIRMTRDILQIYDAREKQDLVYATCKKQNYLVLDNIIKYIDQVKLEIRSASLTDGSSDRIKKLKGKIRDWEEGIAWGHLGVGESDISHMKLSFYSSKDEFFNFDQDIKKVVELLEKIDPDVVTVASEGEIGHKTHIKVFKIVSQAIKLYLQKNPTKKLTIWEYRNVWCQFEPTQANLFFPVTLSDFYSLRNVFHNSYKSQIKALFPMPNFNGPFCDAMQQIMHKQYLEIKNIIGDSYFDKHENNRIKAAHGFCFIKSSQAEQFLIKNNLIVQNDRLEND
jgi:glucosamine-6-phosphate deaminase